MKPLFQAARVPTVLSSLVGLSFALWGCGAQEAVEEGQRGLNPEGQSEEGPTPTNPNSGNGNATAPGNVPSQPTRTYQSLQVVALGDSIAAGTLANSTFGGPVPSNLNLTSLINLPINEAIQRLSSPENSAYVSEANWAFPKRMQTFLGASRLQVHNHSRPGAEVAELSGQFAAFQNTRGPDATPSEQNAVVFALSFGSNDFCDTSITPTQFQTTYEAALTQLTSAYPQSAIVVSELANIPGLLAFNGTISAFVFTVDVNEVRFRECPAFGELADNQLQSRLQSFRAALKNSVEKFRLNGKVALASGIAQESLSADRLAIDGFHPSQRGQAVLAGHLEATARQLLGQTNSP